MYRNKYRPKKWNQFIGNKEIIKSIKNNINSTQCYLLHGERGCGKTTMARLIAKHLKIEKIDIHEIDAASNNGVDDIRKLKSEVDYLPSEGDKKIYIIDECHRLTPQATDAILKTSEEPPEHVIFVFCTTDVKKVTKTIKSRAKTGMYQVKPLQKNEMIDLLKYICEKEKLTVKNDIIKELIKVSEGIPREAVSLLQTIKGLKRKEALKIIQSNLIIENEEIINLCRSLIKFESFSNLQIILKKLKQQNENPESIRRIMLNYMNTVLIGAKNSKSAQRAAYIIECFAEPTYDTDFAGISYATYLACKGK